MPPRRRRSREELEIENTFLRNRRIAEGVSGVAMATVKWSGRCVLGFFGYKSIEAVAGQETTTNIMVQLAQKLSVGPSGDSSLWGSSFLYSS